MFFVRHIDSLIQLGLGVAFTVMGFRRPPMRGANIFRVCGPALIVIGGLLLLKPGSHWQRQFTADQNASAEFPGTPSAMDSTDTEGGISVKRTTLLYNVPGHDMSLFLSYSALPEGARAMTDEERFAATVAAMSQRAKVLHQESSGSIHRLTLREEEKKATLELAIAYAHDNVYRVVASWADGDEDPPLIERFVRSFSLGLPKPQ
jgi:hypothetical protein